MNRSNALASFDIVHIVLDLICVILGFVISCSLWRDSSGLSDDELLTLLPVYLVSVFVFLLVNRSLYIYNTILRIRTTEKQSIMNFAVFYTNNSSRS